jgi:hypothetical protein
MDGQAPIEKIDQSPLFSGLITILAYADLLDLSRKWQPLKRLEARGQTRKAEARVKAQGKRLKAGGIRPQAGKRLPVRKEKKPSAPQSWCQ